jgi:hypothetical protein
MAIVVNRRRPHVSGAIAGEYDLRIDRPAWRHHNATHYHPRDGAAGVAWIGKRENARAGAVLLDRFTLDPIHQMPGLKQLPTHLADFVTAYNVLSISARLRRKRL